VHSAQNILLGNKVYQLNKQTNGTSAMVQRVHLVHNSEVCAEVDNSFCANKRRVSF